MPAGKGNETPPASLIESYQRDMIVTVGLVLFPDVSNGGSDAR